MPHRKQFTTLLVAVFAALVSILAQPASAAAAKPTLTADRTTDLESGVEITVTGTGFAPETSLFIAVCDTAKPPGTACDTADFAKVTTDGDGELKATIEPIARFGSTDCTVTSCALMTNDPAHPRDTRNLARLPITFAGVSATPRSPAPSSSHASSRAADPATDDGSNTGLIVGVVIAVVVVLGVAVVLLTRRRGRA